MTEQEKKIYHVLTYIFLAVLLCHILFAAFSIFNPNKNYLTNQRWEKAYRLFALTGPFFSEERINVIPRVYCSIKEKGSSWRAFEELGTQEFHRYHENYLNFDQLLLSGLPRYLCRQIQVSKDTIVEEDYFQSIKRYIVLSNPKLNIDSVKLIYTLDSFIDAKTDTFFIEHIRIDQMPVK